MAWKRYDGKGSKGDYAFPVVTIHRRGAITINDRALEELGDPERIDLVFDDDDHFLIGLRPSQDGAYAPRTPSGGRGKLFSGSSFLRYIGYDASETERFRASMTEDGILALNLKRPMTGAKAAPARHRAMAGDSPDEPNDEEDP